MDSAEREALFARVAAARRDHRAKLIAKDCTPIRRRAKKSSAPLQRWLVQCPNNDLLTTVVVSPMKPNFCPVCGGRSPKVMEPQS